jgi:hypothetical protein
MTKNEYNGWYNYETWLFNLWHDDAFADDAAEAHRHSKGTEDAIDQLADAIEAFAEEFVAPKEGHGFATDIMNSALQEINYREIAKHYIEQLEQEAA